MAPVELLGVIVSSEDIIKRRPVDATASKVTSSPSDLYRHEFNTNYRHVVESDVQPEIREWPKHTSPQSHNITGQRFGRLVVIGLKVGGSKWVCRCDCGKYCFRDRPKLAKMTGKSMIDGAGMCEACYQLIRLKCNDFFNRHGRYMTDQEKVAAFVGVDAKIKDQQ